MESQIKRHGNKNPYKLTRRPISINQWKFFHYRVEQLEMEPEEFLNHWECNYNQIAQICSCSRNTVAHWFAKGNRRPSKLQKICLGLAHQLLLKGLIN
ncbi:MAG: hypothetical protein F6K47_41100 [Symploca sp. SIO2E6]|nr:hypothetical protein [Symploca sp. SIO2E6]